MTDEEALVECQREIRRLRIVVRVLEEEHALLRKQCNELHSTHEEENNESHE